MVYWRQIDWVAEMKLTPYFTDTFPYQGHQFTVLLKPQDSQRWKRILLFKNLNYLARLQWQVRIQRLFGDNRVAVAIWMFKVPHAEFNQVREFRDFL